MKRVGIAASLSLLLISGCLPGAPETEPIVEKGKEDEKLTISRDIETSERYYRSVLPYHPSDSRGFILFGVDNRLDIDEFETGLIRLSQEVFDPDDYFIRDGQILKEEEVQAWIDRRSKKNPKGLNPELGVSESASVKEKIEANKQNPRYLSFVLEQNYMVEKGDKIALGGISIGISLNSIYYYSVMDNEGKIHSGEVDLRENRGKIIDEGKRMAQQIVNELRAKKEAENVPIMVALFLEEPRDALIPGRFMATATVDKGKTAIGSWDTLDERYYLFPSEEVAKDHRSDSDQFQNFKGNIESFFPNFTAVIGRGFYVDGKLRKMAIDIRIQFHGKSEVIALTQYVTDLVVTQFFSDDIPLEVNIASMEKQEAVIVKTPGEKEPFVHVYQ